MQDAYYAALRELIQPIRAADYARTDTLEPMRELMRELGDPQLKYPSIVVAGSVGKTSMCYQVAAGLQASGRGVGRYISPHLHSFRERCAVDDEIISMREFVEMWGQVKAAIQRTRRTYSTFEAATALCLLWFAHKQVTTAVLEIGLGGRFDAVNVVPNKLAIITPIEIEHAATLGGTLESIAWHKAGVMQPNEQVYIMPQSPEVTAVLTQEAQAQHVDVVPKLQIEHKFLTLSPAGRMEYITYRKQPLVIDGAHTVSSARRLYTQLTSFGSSEIGIVIGMLRDKSVADVLSVFDQAGWHLIFTTPDASRAVSAADLAVHYLPTRASYEVIDLIDDAFEKLVAGSTKVRVVTGSLRMAAAAREFFKLVSPPIIEESRLTRQIYDEKNAAL